MARSELSHQIIATLGLCLAVAVGIGAETPVRAQDSAAPTSENYIEALKTCRAISDERDRLVCYDQKVAAMVSANEAGDMQIVDREDLRQTRRQLFGFNVPEIGLLKGKDQDKEANELFETTITGARRLSSKAWRFTTAEGAVWEINNAPSRLVAIKAGDKVEFKKASLGFFFIRINGQMGIKGKRIQ